MDPLAVFIEPLVLLGAGSHNYINELSLDKDTYETITESAIDPYMAIQDAYLQYRAKKIKE